MPAAWDEAAKALVAEALAAPVPPLEEAAWGGRGPYFRFAGEAPWYGGDAGDTAEVVELAWHLPPYRSVWLREGWEARAEQ